MSRLRVQPMTACTCLLKSDDFLGIPVSAQQEMVRHERSRCPVCKHGTKILCSVPGCEKWFPAPDFAFGFPAVCNVHCQIGHLDGSFRDAVAIAVCCDDEPLCEECARGMKALGHDVRPKEAR